VAAFGALGHWLLILAHKRAPASIVAPFFYAQLLWATLLGWLVFGEVPDRWTLVGGAIVMSSGLYLLSRERARHKGG
jgi:drug/metabolite transporter (DMT)-like permease